MRRSLLATAIAGVAAISPGAQAQVTSGGQAPDTFDVDASAAPIVVAVSAPSVLPLDVTAGVGFSGAKLNSQPKGTAEAAPGYVPLLDALPLLGGTGALPQIGARLLPGLLLGFPTILGLPPLPIDPALVPAPDVPVLPVPALPPVGCSASTPGDPEPIRCGGPTQDVLGFEVGAASGTASAKGDPADVSTLRVDSAVRSAGFGPSPSNTLLPLSVEGIASSATSYIEDGRVVGAVSTKVLDLSIAGLIKIPAMETSLSAALDGTRENAAVRGERCTITGATIAGVPVSIDGDGIHIVDEDLPLGALLGAANDLVQTTLGQLGVTLKTVAGQADPGTARAEAFPGEVQLSEDGTELAASLGCREVGYSIPTSGTNIKLSFGVAQVKMQAFGSATAAPSGANLAGESGSVGSGITSPEAGSGLSLDPLVPSAGAAPPPAAPIPGVGAVVPSDVPFQEVGFGWKVPYSPFAIFALALPLGAIWSRRIGPLPIHRASRLIRVRSGSGSRRADRTSGRS
jgi:hypothetical protein